MLEKINRSVLFVFVICSLASCGIKQTILFRDAQSNAVKSPPKQLEYEHTFNPDDKFMISVWGHPELSTEILFGNPTSYLAPAGATPLTATTNEEKALVVNKDGKVMLPRIGEAAIQGLTISQAENLIQEKYKVYYTDALVKIRIVNKRVNVLGEVVKPGIIELKKEQTTLPEVIAAAGDFTFDGNRTNVKIIRGNLKNPTVIVCDLTTMEGLKGDLTIHADDIVYVQPIKRKISSRIVSDVLPYLSVLASVLTLINIALIVSK